jgi:hypothetical protein
MLVWADRKPGAPSLELPQVKKDPNAGSGRTYDQLFVRHWDAWANGDRSQLFVLPFGPQGATGNGIAIGGELIGDTPSKPFGGGEELNWSPDGKTVYFAMTGWTTFRPYRPTANGWRISRWRGQPTRPIARC